MSIKNTIKKIWYSLYPSGKVILLDYPSTPQRSYVESHPHTLLYPLIEKNKASYRQLLMNTLQYAPAFASIKEDKNLTDENEPGWNNDHFPGLDIIMLYSLLAQLKPSRYIEIGSGTSTKVAARSKRDNGLSVSITAIDPSSRKVVDGIADKVIKKRIQDIDLSLFESLGENDIVFFDGTHTLLPGSDVLWFFWEVLPRLKKGIIVQVHDVYLPYDYPDFMCRRHYNEQYLLGSILLGNSDKYEILFPGYFVYTQKELLNILDPVWQLPALQHVEKHGGSFWFRVKN